MEEAILIVAALAGSALTFFSGFGLGTLLLPVFGLFLPIDAAVAATAVVHFANNVFKLGLTWRYINFGVLLRFGLPALLAAALGAFVLNYLSNAAPLYNYQLGRFAAVITWPKLVIGPLMLLFGLADLVPGVQRWSVAQQWLPVGGFLSGFFGGLSGHQGALRSMFLIRLGLHKITFVATGVGIACLIDLVRLAAYSRQDLLSKLPDKSILIIAILASITGALIGNYFLKKVTLTTLQVVVAIFIMAFALLLMAGIV